MKNPSKWRYETVLDLINKNNYKSYAEIGLGKGKTIRHLVKNITDPDFILYGIDPYERYSELHGKGLRHSEDSFKYNMKEMLDSVSDERFVFYNEYSHDGASHFEDRSIDFIFIDGNHTFKHVLQDMKDWYPKVRDGGILAGHDYYSPGKTHQYRQVGKAVDKFCKEIKVDTLFAPDHVWYFYKK